MTKLMTHEIIIEGLTNKGKKFRPSDWAERLSGILSSFNQDNRLSYHQYVRPLLINQIRCVAVDKQLQKISPDTFRFLLDFAHDNDLHIIDPEQMTENSVTDAENQPSPDVITSLLETKEITLKTENKPKIHAQEILAEDTEKAFLAILSLRPHLPSANQFITLVNEVLRPQGYRLIGLFEEGRSHALAICGFRVLHNLAWGRYLNIDDLATLPEFRNQGLAKKILNEIHQEAERLGHLPIHLDSSVDESRKDSHRLYFNSGYRITSYHFMHNK